MKDWKTIKSSIFLRFDEPTIPFIQMTSHPSSVAYNNISFYVTINDGLQSAIKYSNN